MLKKWISKYQYLIITILVLLIFLIFGVVSLNNIQKNDKKLAADYAYDATKSKLSTLYERFDGDFDVLDSIGISLVLLEYDSASLDDQALIGFLENINETNSFSKIGFAKPDGQAVVASLANDSYTFDYSTFDFFNSIKNTHKKAIANIDIDNGELAIHYATPVFKNDILVGVLIGVKDYQNYQEILSSAIFNNTGYFGIVSENKEIIAISRNANNITTNTSIYNYFSINEDYTSQINESFGQKDTISFSLKYDETTYNALLISLSSPDKIIPSWYLLSFYPADTYSPYIRQIMTTYILIIISAAILFIGIITLQIIREKRNEQKLKKIAFTDPVTLDGNIYKFYEDALTLINKKEQNYCFWSFDIKDFSNLNDIFGQEGGDLVLKKVSDYFKTHKDITTLFARTSGDNFVGMVEFDSKEEMIKRFDRVKDYFEKFDLYDNHDLRIFIGVGFYIYDKTEELAITEMVNRAVLAKKYSKKINNSSYHFFSLEMSKAVQLQADIESNIHDAIANGEITFYLQPRINVQENTIEGAEALARWFSKEHGIIPPGDFVPVLERAGLVKELDSHIFECVCRWYVSNEEIKKYPISISVNISRQALLSENFTNYYINAKKEFNIPDGLLELEFTESIAATDYEHFAKQIIKLKDAGFLCAIDDFGTGFSSLNALKNLPIDVLKLDSSFFRSTIDKNRENTVVSSLINLSKSLGIRTVAEGIEDCRQAELLRSMGLDVIQGYVFSKPLTKEDYMKYLIENDGKMNKCLL